MANPKALPRKRVKGYTRSDGTYVKGYLRARKAPTLKSRPAKPPKAASTLKSRSGPKGFKRVTPLPRELRGVLPPNIAALQEIAAEQQRHSLMGVARELDHEGRVTTAVHVHKNRDGTVDGELRISNIRRGYKIDDLIVDVSTIWHGQPPDYSEWKLPENAGHWISPGALTDWGRTGADWQTVYDKAKDRGATDAEARERANAATSPLPRYRGKDRVALHAMLSRDLPALMFRARQGMLGEAKRALDGTMIGRGDRSKPTDLLFRVYWNPWGASPGSVGGRGHKRKKRRQVTDS